MENKHSQFLSAVRAFVPKTAVYTDGLRRFAWGTDAGFYRLVPKIVIRSSNEKEVSRILRAASKYDVPVTFRAAGTSLSGQSISDSVLVVAGKNWERYKVSEDGERITLEPGIIGSRVNAILKPYGRKFGPDPASIGSCMVGGIVMNNASGMSCGTHANSDRELESVRMVFADGSVLDTGDKASREAFRASHPDFIKGIEELRDEILADKELSDRIRYKYSIKNVTGLNIFPFVRFQDPFDIMAHLLVGSEGTLAFMSQVTMKTLPLPAKEASAMVYFGTIREAAEAVVALRKDIDPAALDAAELLDKRSLASVDDPMLKDYPDKDLTALLLRVTGAGQEDLEANVNRLTDVLRGFSALKGADGDAFIFSSDPAVAGKYWAIRSGIFPSVGGMRREGTTCLIEDIAFHIEDLPDATEDLSALLDRHGYDDSCIYGHALEGNFHFIINQSFDSEAEVRRYEAMIRDVAEMVVGKYDGSLKAEHGTGRNMAPFVKYEWGEKAFGVMRRVKELFDPHGLLNPGVIFNDDPECFLKNFKALPVLKPWADDSKAVEPELAEIYKKLNKCIECGFCEVNCLSCGFTLSSRTRIATQREITSLRELPDPTASEQTRLRTLEKEYSYTGEQTCAGDGLCSTSCPMGINVADLTHQLRRVNMPEGSFGHGFWNFVAGHYAGVKSGLRGALRMATAGETVLGDLAMSGLCRWLHNAIRIPLWTPATPKAYNIPKSLRALVSSAAVGHDGASTVYAATGPARLGSLSKCPDSQTSEAATGMPTVCKVVYFPSCINQMMGLPKHHHTVDKPLVEEMVSLLGKAGYEVIFPENMSSLCCGTIWESKGMPEIADRKTAELEEALWQASEQGRYPVLCDQSPCLHRMKHKIKKMRLYEPAEFILGFLADRLDFHQTDTPVAIHLTCSMRLMHKTGKMLELARMCSTNVLVPEGVGCCGFAGDKGMTHPELNKYALRKLKDQVKGIPVGYSNSRTCEIGLATNSGIPYVSIAYLVNRCTTAKSV
ncbi:MAG: FAD-binding and (Fe-S)-binding domain-containing protein [Candidatus Cryptobacteroides sp.]|nr:FAD-binding and (Fe-S)-binding domain-containing protein [Candidatus Cryptobacteroides sp.]